jgi:hypothetical protein
LGSGFVWLQHHVSNHAIVLVGAAFFVASMAIIGASVSKPSIAWKLLLTLIGGVGSGALAASLEHNVIGSYAYVTATALPIVWIAYKHESRRYKECPECCESVRAGARVCRYCHSAFAPADPN